MTGPKGISSRVSHPPSSARWESRGKRQTLGSRRHSSPAAAGTGVTAPGASGLARPCAQARLLNAGPHQARLARAFEFSRGDPKRLLLYGFK